MKKISRIGLFGGTFDPIHLGHIHIAEAAVRELELDRVVFLPCRQSPHKESGQAVAAQHRLAMCQLATKNFDWAVVDDFDLTAPAPSYSWRTAETMQDRFPDGKLFWLMGTDQWLALPRWNRSEHLAGLVDFIVFSRGEKPEPREGYQLHAIDGHHPASATVIRRDYLANEVADWLSPEVLRYIRDNALYAKRD